MDDIKRIMSLAEVEVDPQEIETQGYDPIAIAKTIHNANLYRRIHNADKPEVVSGSTVIEVENSQYHNEPTPIHTRYVGSLLRYWTNITQVPANLPEYVYQTLGYEPGYIEDLLTSQTDDPELNSELDIKRELFVKIENFVQNLSLNNQAKTILMLWGYFHDLGKIFRPYLKETFIQEGDIQIKKDKNGQTIKHENRLNEFTTGFTPLESEEHEYLEKHTLSFLQLFYENGMINMDMFMGIKNLHNEYSKVSFLIKGESKIQLSEDFSDLQKLALVALAADELGKGVIFRDKTGHHKRMKKLTHLKSLTGKYL